MDRRATRPLSQRGELKYLDISFPAVGQSALLVFPINIIAAGTDNTNRIGRTARIAYCMYNLHFINHQTTNGATPLRVMVVWDRQPNGTVASYNDIINVNALPGENTLGMPNIDNKDRFTILSDVVTSVGSIAPAFPAAAPVHKHMRKLVRVNRMTQYNSTVGNSSAITSGALYLVLHYDQDGSLLELDVTGTTRIRFTDD